MWVKWGERKVGWKCPGRALRVLLKWLSRKHFALPRQNVRCGIKPKRCRPVNNEQPRRAISRHNSNFARSNVRLRRVNLSITYASKSRAVSRVVRKNNEFSFNAMLAFAAGFLTCVAMEMVWSGRPLPTTARVASSDASVRTTIVERHEHESKRGTRAEPVIVSRSFLRIVNLQILMQFNWIVGP